MVELAQKGGLNLPLLPLPPAVFFEGPTKVWQDAGWGLESGWDAGNKAN